MARAKTELVYEIRSDGKVLGQFSSEGKAKKELSRLRREGMSVRIRSKWMERSAVRPSKKAKEGPRPIVCTVHTTINEYLKSKGERIVEHDMTFGDLYVAVVAERRLLDEVLGDCGGREDSIIEGIVRAMGAKCVTERFIRSTLEGTAKRRMSEDPGFVFDPSMYEVSADAATDLERYWRSLGDPFMLGTYRNGRLCDPDRRESDLSVQPSDDGLKLCHRDIGTRKVSIIMASVDCVRVAGSDLELKGRGPDGSRVVYRLRIHEQPSRKAEVSGPGFRPGWYLVPKGFLLFIQESEEPLEPEYSRPYDRYVDYSVVYPGFNDYGMDGGLIAYRDSGGLKAFLKENFQTQDAEYIDIDDPDDLRAALEEGDRRAIGEYVSEYPRLGAILGF